MNQFDLDKTIKYVKEQLQDDVTGHDWWHVDRVWRTAQHIADKESANVEVVTYIALLHDIADHKFYNGDREIGVQMSKDWLDTLDLAEEVKEKIVAGIQACSYSKGLATPSLEAAIVQDADRLDAIGAIGIARAFATGSHMGSFLYDPTATKEEQKTTVGHFYQKLLKLKGGMNTEVGKKLAEVRHQRMENFLDQFYEEWGADDLK